MATFVTFSSALFWFFFFIFFSFLSLPTFSQPRVNHLRTFCNNNSASFADDSSYEENRKDVLQYLRGTGPNPAPFYLSVTKGFSPDIVYVMHHCRGDITKSTCGVCVRKATTEIRRTCETQKEAFVYNEECMVRYSDYSFDGLLEGPDISTYSPTNFSSTSRFSEILSDNMDDLIKKAASTTLFPEPYMARDQIRVTESDGSYLVDSLVQCTPDLDKTNCTVCLKVAVKEILGCCSLSRSAQTFLPKCLVRYNTSSVAVGTGRPETGRPDYNGVIKGNKIFGRISIAFMSTSVLALIGLISNLAIY